MIKLLTGDVRAMLATMPDASVQCVVTSPPYYGLRDYGVAGQLGLEATPEAYIATLVQVFREIRRVLRDDGTLWLNMGDSYNSYRGNAGPGNPLSSRNQEARQVVPGGVGLWVSDAKPKDLLMMPARLALALQADGWWLRSDIIWAKPNPMPESVTDRPTSAHEHVFLLTKRSRYFYDADAVREPHTGLPPEHCGVRAQPKDRDCADARVRLGEIVTGAAREYNPAGRSCRNVWTIATAPFPAAHFATFPPELAERCIRAGTSERGCCAACGKPWVRVVERTAMGIDRSERTHPMGRTRTSGTMLEPPTSITTGWAAGCQCNAEVAPCVVLDPFSGAGTALLVADRLGRGAIGIDLNHQYVEMARARLEADCPLFAEVTDTPPAAPLSPRLQLNLLDWLAAAD